MKEVRRRTRVVGAVPNGSVLSQSCCRAAWLHRRDNVVDQMLDEYGTHPTSAVLSDAWYFAKRVTLSLALRSSGDAG